MTEPSIASTEKKKGEKPVDAKDEVASGVATESGEKKAKKKIKRAIPHAHAYIFATFNNTLVSITAPNGEVVASSSAGSSNFKGARKATPYAAQVAAENAIDKASVFGIETIDIFIKGVGAGREQAIRGIHAKGIDIKSIIDTTPIPHNGCRKKKVRRV